MQQMQSNLAVREAKFVEDWIFSNGDTAPVYEVFSAHALNQLIGYAKHINRDYGNVYYRGQTGLYKSLLASLYRKYDRISSAGKVIGKTITKIKNDSRMQVRLRLDKLSEWEGKIAIEGMLQHYGLKTRYLDLVDNHWVALWMGLYEFKSIKQVTEYGHYVKRELPFPELINGTAKEEDFYQYILLLAFPYSEHKTHNGISRCGDYVIVDLRQALPSTLLRPHAQHGLLARKISNSPDSKDYDMSGTIVGIIKIRIDRAAEWLGTGELLVQENLFPSPAHDNGYDVLLFREDLFADSEQKIIKYV